MKIYICLIEDRHCDPDIELFTIESAAIEFAKMQAEEYCRGDASEIETYKFKNQADGWIVSFRYSCEGDRVSVIEKDLNEA